MRLNPAFWCGNVSFWDLQEPKLFRKLLHVSEDRHVVRIEWDAAVKQRQRLKCSKYSEMLNEIKMG